MNENLYYIYLTALTEDGADDYEFYSEFYGTREGLKEECESFESDNCRVDYVADAKHNVVEWK